MNNHILSMDIWSKAFISNEERDSFPVRNEKARKYSPLLEEQAGQSDEECTHPVYLERPTLMAAKTNNCLHEVQYNSKHKLTAETQRK